MGANWSVTLVSRDGEEIQVAADVLSSASTVWRERLQLAGSLSPPPRSEENCSAEEINAFVRVISARSNEAATPATDIPVEALLQSLPLVHKYDCNGIKLMLDDLDSTHFPDDGIVVKSGMLHNGRWVVPKGCTVQFFPHWLTQAHLDYLVLKQELYGSDAVLTKPMQRLLAKLLTTPNLYCGVHFADNTNTYAQMRTSVDNHNKLILKLTLVEPLLATATTVGSGALPSLKADPDLVLTGSTLELAVGGCKIGAAVGALLGTALLHAGRRICFLISGVGYVAGPMLMASASCWEWLALGRVVVGLGIGLSAVAAPAYLGEVAPAAVRGAIVATYELMLCLGLLAAAFTDWLLAWLAAHDPAASPLPALARWRLMLGLPALPGVLLLFGAGLLPESPAHLVARGRADEAFALLLRLHGGDARVGRRTSERSESGVTAVGGGGEADGPSDAAEGARPGGSGAACPLLAARRQRQAAALEAAQAELDALGTALGAARRRRGGGRARLCGRERRAALLMALLAVANQANGSSTLVNYAGLLLVQDDGVDSQAAQLQSLYVGAAKLAAVLLAMRLVDRVGRRPLLLAGAAATAGALGLLAYAFGRADAGLTLAALLLFVCSYGVSLAPTFFVLLSELFSDGAKPLAAGLATALTFAAGALVDTTFLSLRAALGDPATCALLAGVCLAGGAAVLWLLPETKGRTRHEVQRLMGGGDENDDEEEEEEEEAQQLLAHQSSSALILAS